MYVKLCALFINALRDGFDNRNQKKEQNKLQIFVRISGDKLGLGSFERVTRYLALFVLEREIWTFPKCASNINLHADKISDTENYTG